MRAREADVVIRHLPTGPNNTITDIEGVRVGHRTVGGFNRSSQHLDDEGLLWDNARDDVRIGPSVRRCGRLAGRRWRGGRIGSGSGRRSPAACRVRTPRWNAACRRRSGRGGSARLGACRRSPWPRSRGVTCRWPRERRLPCSRRRTVAFETLPAGSAATRERSPESCAATPPPVAAGWSTGPRQRSGMPSGGPSAPRPQNSLRTRRCASTCSNGFPGRSRLQMAA